MKKMNVAGCTGTAAPEQKPGVNGSIVTNANLTLNKTGSSGGASIYYNGTALVISRGAFAPLPVASPSGPATQVT